MRCSVISRAALKSSMRTHDTSSRARPVASATAGTPSAAKAAAMAFDSHSGGGRITPAMPSASFCAAAFSCAGLRLSQRSSTSCAAVRCEPSSAPTSISRQVGGAGIRIDERDARVARAGQHAGRGIRPVVERAHGFHDELARGVAHVAFAVDDARHRHRRHAGVARDFVNGDGAALAASGLLRETWCAVAAAAIPCLAQSISPQLLRATGARLELALTIDSTRCRSPIPHEASSRCWHVSLAVGFSLRARSAEDGYDLWLRYPRGRAAAYPASRVACRASWSAKPQSPTLEAAQRELMRGLAGLAGCADSRVVGTPTPGRRRALRHAAQLAADRRPAAGAGARAGREGYVDPQRDASTGRPATVIAANSDVGVLYGAFHFLRLLQTRQPLDGLDIASQPRTQHPRARSLGQSRPARRARLRRPVDLGLAQAAGLAGSALHRLRARLRLDRHQRQRCSPTSTPTPPASRPPYLEKAAALAGVFRPYGMRVYLTARFSAPIELGGLKTADPLDPAVRAWWKAKIDEIYRYIPDFGGFLVKANSEGQPGPQDYHRTHADGANMLAGPLAPHGGIVMWRAFVYSSDNTDDRAKQAYAEFVPLDGKFADNVLVQVKNGPIDFQPREPFSSAVRRDAEDAADDGSSRSPRSTWASPRTSSISARCSRRRCARTRMATGKGSTVAKVIDGALHGYKLTGMAGVANIGTDRNWSGSHFDQANWYAFGRLAWDPDSVGARHRRRLGAHDLLQRSRVREAGGRDDDGLARGGGRLHDAARARAPDGHRASLRPGALGQRSGARRTGTRLTTIAPTRTASASIAGPAGSNAVAQYSPQVAAIFADPEEDAGEPAAVVPPRALGLPHVVGPHAVGRAGVSLHARRRRR